MDKLLNFGYKQIDSSALNTQEFQLSLFVHRIRVLFNSESSKNKKKIFKTTSQLITDRPKPPYSSQFRDAIKSLVIELYIRALTTDMNELETQKSKSNKEKVRETARRLSQEFLRLADYVGDNVGIARECVLTAFSLHPTRVCYDRIRELAVACGKISRPLKAEPADVKVEIKVIMGLGRFGGGIFQIRKCPCR